MNQSASFWQHARRIQTVLLMMTIFMGGFVIGTIFSTSEAQGRVTISDTDEAFAPFWEVYNMIQTRYIDPVPVEILVEGAINGMLGSLDDEYSFYYSPEDWARRNEDIEGSFEGVGATIRTIEETGEVEIVRTIQGSPAEAAGLMPGDIFVAVDGEAVKGLNSGQLANLVRGPAGTPVTITMRRGEELIEFTIIRARLEIPNVEFEMLDNDIAYIRLYQFNQLSLSQMQNAIDALDVNDAQGLIVDLRGNPGGSLNAVVDITSLFLEDGVVLYEVFGDGSETEFPVSGTYAGVTVPIVVLVDESSASASELMSGALQDTAVARIMGETTFGKGVVQTLSPLSNGGGMQVTIARYLTPNRNWVQDKGVVPDVLIPWDGQPGDEDDPQLDAAIDFIINGE